MTALCACLDNGGVWLAVENVCRMTHSPLGCCSNNADRCCPYFDYLGYGQCTGNLYPTCACELDGGLWNGTTQSCGFGFDAGIDAGPADAAADASDAGHPTDASDDGG